MKKILLIIVLLWSIPAFSQIKSATLTASGLTCSMCSKAIYKALLKVPSIKSVVPDVEKSSYAIVFKEGTSVVIDDVKKAVTDAGFSVANLQLTIAFNNTEVYNDAHVTSGGIAFHFLNVPKQALNGDRKITVIDKDYLPQNEYRKYAKYTKMKCFETGYMAACCPMDHNAAKRIYHVTL